MNRFRIYAGLNRGIHGLADPKEEGTSNKQRSDGKRIKVNKQTNKNDGKKERYSSSLLPFSCLILAKQERWNEVLFRWSCTKYCENAKYQARYGWYQSGNPEKWPMNGQLKLGYMCSLGRAA